MVWYFNVLLWCFWVLWTANPVANPQYPALVAEGWPCWVQATPAIGVPNAQAPGMPQPACWYDPSNTNSGTVGRLPESMSEPVAMGPEGRAAPGGAIVSRR
jgi:hypothetical protein